MTPAQTKAARPVNFYKRYMADYISKTGRLTLAEHGAYALLLDECYATESGLPSDLESLYRICRAMTKPEQQAVRSVAESFFPVGDDGLRHNERARKELDAAAVAVAAARENGKRGGRPKKPTGLFGSEPTGFSVGSETETQSEPSTKASHSSDIEEPNGSLSASSESDGDGGLACPHGKLLELWAEHCPMLIQPRRSLWAGSEGARSLRQRWRWVLTAKEQGARLATNEPEALEWFGRFFAYIATCPHLVGSNSRGWQADLAWVLKAANFAKVMQGNYENKNQESA